MLPIYSAPCIGSKTPHRFLQRSAERSPLIRFDLRLFGLLTALVDPFSIQFRLGQLESLVV